ncbi:PaaI family thioesterase [Desulfosarcina sp.]|uniref:PaaI family thioesterase n=1 Tax=Desulfosarcina sp. TaxID=2027861 RepID=UPI0029AA4FB3|nr:PaaI family thioesterase [Desulfosarcina sp.]MDX2452684.1 PaaI family thioesterase [Desulfosarcina sp.]
MTRIKTPKSISEWNSFGKDYLPGHLGLEILSVKPDELLARMKVQLNLCAPNGLLHAASVVALADTACGYATINSLPNGAIGHATIELKINFIGTALEGDVSCLAKLVHKGRTTQVWDAEVSVDETGKKIAHFRCTQIILWPKGSTQK